LDPAFAARTPHQFTAGPGRVAMDLCREVGGIDTRRSDFMRFYGKTCVATLGLGLFIGLACALSGCDTGGAKAEYKPIQTDILKKLGSANPGQSEAVQAKVPARAKKKQ
jgi:hypothetical protein